MLTDCYTGLCFIMTIKSKIVFLCKDNNKLQDQKVTKPDFKTTSCWYVILFVPFPECVIAERSVIRVYLFVSAGQHRAATRCSEDF